MLTDVKCETMVRLQVGMLRDPWPNHGVSGLKLKVWISKNRKGFHRVYPKIEDMGRLKKGLYIVHLRRSYLDTVGRLDLHFKADGALDTILALKVHKLPKKLRRRL